MDEFSEELGRPGAFVHLVGYGVSIALLHGREGRGGYPFHLGVPERHICRVLKEGPDSPCRTVDENAIYKFHEVASRPCSPFQPLNRNFMHICKVAQMGLIEYCVFLVSLFLRSILLLSAKPQILHELFLFLFGHLFPRIKKIKKVFIVG